MRATCPDHHIIPDLDTLTLFVEAYTWLVDLCCGHKYIVCRNIQSDA
jgi:hypothetical protein